MTSYEIYVNETRKTIRLFNQDHIREVLTTLDISKHLTENRDKFKATTETQQTKKDCNSIHTTDGSDKDHLCETL